MNPKIILDKYNEIKKAFPNNAEFKSWIQRSDLWNWIYSVLTISGEKVHKTSIVNMMDGILVDDLPLSMYAYVQNWQDIYSDMKEYISMKSSLEPKMLYRWAKMLKSMDPNADDSEILRKNHGAVYEWELIPVAETEVRTGIGEILKSYNKKNFNPEDPLEKAVKLHLRLNRLYAFGEDTFSVSMIALMYALLSLGYPIPELPLKDTEYNTIMAKHMESKDYTEFKDILERALYNRLEIINSYSKEAKND